MNADRSVDGIEVNRIRLTTQILKIIAILSLISLTIAAIVAHQQPASGFELSLYDSTPFVVWICLFLAFTGGGFIILHQIWTKGYENSRIWLLGLLPVILTRIVVLYIPFIRGYATWNGDHITHIGLVKDLVASGHISANNIYPATHILLSQISSISGAPDIAVTNLSTALLSVVFVMSTYLLATAVLPHRGQHLLVGLLAGGIFFAGGYNVLLSPNGWSILLLPLLLYFYFKRSSFSYSVLLILLLVLYPFLHPLSCVIIIIVLATLELSVWLMPPVYRLLKKQSFPTSVKPSLIPLLIELAVFFPWALSFQQFNFNLRVMWQQILTGIGPRSLAEIGSKLDMLGLKDIDVIVLFLKNYGVTFVFIVISLVTGVLLLRKANHYLSVKDRISLFPLVCAFSLLGVIYICYLLGMPGIGPIVGERVLSYVEILLPVLAVVGLCRLLWIDRNLVRNLARGAVICLFVLCSVMSTASLFLSPYVLQPNDQVTKMDLNGVSWFIEEKNTTIPCSYVMSPLTRYVDGIVGVAESNRRVDIIQNTVQFSDHFGYHEYSTLGEQYSEDKYFAATELDRTIYTNVWREVGRFNDFDFMKLESDVSVSRTYSNGELSVYLILSSESMR